MFVPCCKVVLVGWLGCVAWCDLAVELGGSVLTAVFCVGAGVDAVTGLVVAYKSAYWSLSLCGVGHRVCYAYCRYSEY